MTDIAALVAELRAEATAIWIDFLDANPSDVTSPEEYPDHALMTLEEFVSLAAVLFERYKPTPNLALEAALAGEAGLREALEEVAGSLGFFTDGDALRDMARAARTARAKTPGGEDETT